MYYIYPDIKAVKEGTATEKNIRRIAANIGNIPALRRLLGSDPEDFARFYPDTVTTTPSTLSTIDTFLATYSKNPPAPQKKPHTLAQLIKSKQYEAAIERIKEQNLNNPEKSIYFADQIRFLRKLILLRDSNTVAE